MQTEIILMPAKKIVGQSMNMCLSENRTGELWRSFMVRRNEVLNRIGEEYYSISVYAPDFHISHMNMETEFVKWAGVEVASADDVPKEMKFFEIPEGLYAVFIHKGGMEAFGDTMNHIFSEWLPTSEFEWDNRPQFEVLGKKYKNNSDDSEEAVWIPIRKK